MRKQNKFLIAFVGPVGSGKSYIAEILAKKLGAIHIRTDDIRVKLRTQGKPYTTAPRIAANLRDTALEKGTSVVADFDAVLPRRQHELKKIANTYHVYFFLIQVQTPEKLIIHRLRRKHYTKKESDTPAKGGGLMSRVVSKTIVRLDC